ncbi:MAG: response regulator transcription factor [Candidatus Nanopelagicales bacterium]|nr:response regulator transcription factor [Candidatus Nanopelagicales bacterium]MDZ4249077.1 response regulator transcription factor [Candidatus Nanopelagicales bacterium]
MSERIALVVDDHDVVRWGVRQALADVGYTAVECATVGASYRILAGLSRLDVAVIDHRLPDGDGLSVAEAARAFAPEAGIVVFSMWPSDRLTLAAVHAGANAVICKDQPMSELLNALEAAVARPMSFVATNLGAALREQSGPRLTAREHEVLSLVSEGLSVSQVSRRLNVSESTAKTHVGRIYTKLGANNRAQAIMLALRKGILAQPM